MIGHPPSSYSVPLPPSPPHEDGKQGTDLSFETVISQVTGLDTPARTPRTSGTVATRTPMTSMGQSVVGDEHKRAWSEPNVEGPLPQDIGRQGRRSSGKGQEKEKIKLDDFELIRVVGKGAAGRVLLVRHAARRTIHAMKAISMRSVLTHDELYHTLAELSILSTIAEAAPANQFISRLNYAFTDRENFYFVMDFYPGGDLATQMEMTDRLGHCRARFYITDLVQGLEDIHRHGIVVRDLKPENILINSRGHAVLADFGLSKAFGYRGDPQAIYVPRYENDSVLPPWAGLGMGSMRMSTKGRMRITVDRCHSFVGTAEYLAPEIIKRREYSYAVDWWALGVILFECLVGRVPFRSSEEESPYVLYEKIVNYPWDCILDEPRHSKRRLKDWEIDHVTASFLDALLQKEPELRITEPAIKLHPFFADIDWHLVATGNYSDPFDLNLHPMAEYNTRYFPRLCLDEEVSVDMSTHKGTFGVYDEYQEPGSKTPLNDNDTFILERARFAKELRGFYWDCRDHEPATPSNVGLEADASVEAESEDTELRSPVKMGRMSSTASIGRTKLAVYDSSLSLEQFPDTPAPAPDHSVSTPQDQNQTPLTPTSVSTIDSEQLEEDTSTLISPEATPVSISISSHGDGDVTRTPPRPDLAATPLGGTMPTMQLGSPVSSPDRPVTPPVPAGNLEADGATYRAEASQPEALHPEALSDTHAPPLLSPKSSPRLAAVKIIKALPPVAVLPGSRPEREISRLPSGLPSSGLSVSDVVSIPSPGIEGPRILRRHPHLASIDSAPMSRLSVELHGTVTQLGEDDWDALDGDCGADVPSEPNGGTSGQTGFPPSSFFNRLRRKPSAIVTSGLRRQARTSDSSAHTPSSREGSPTKSRTPGFGMGLGRGGGTGTGKRVVSRFKAFPKLRLRNRSGSGDVEEAGEARPAAHLAVGKHAVDAAAIVSVTAPSTPPRPEPTRRHTASTSAGPASWFDRKSWAGPSSAKSKSGPWTAPTSKSGASTPAAGVSRSTSRKLLKRDKGGSLSSGSSTTSASTMGKDGGSVKDRGKGTVQKLGGSLVLSNRRTTSGGSGSEHPPRIELPSVDLELVDWGFAEAALEGNKEVGTHRTA